MKFSKQKKLKTFSVIVAALLLGMGSLLTSCATADSKGSDQTQIYFLRHAEIDKSTKDKPLNTKGKTRADELVKHFSGKRITHIYATHTDRTRDTVAPLAKKRGVSLKQIPAPGSSIKGETVTNRSKGKIAIKPLIKTLQNLPKGSSVVVSANSGNIFAVMAGMGVPVRESCKNNSNGCLPCKSKSCFPKKQFNNIWTVTPGGDTAGMVHSTYGK